jgi:hypothetical protein
VQAESEAEEINPGRWLNSTQAFRHFGFYSGPTQSAQHIRPLHWYAALREMTGRKGIRNDLSRYEALSLVI